MKKADLVISIVMMCTGAGAMIKAADYPAQSKMIPYIYSAALILFSFLLAVTTLLKRGENPKNEDSIGKEEPIKRVLLIIGMIFGYIASVEVLGFYTSTSLFLLIFMGVLRAASLATSFAVSVGTAVVVYFFFETLLNIPVPVGLFF